MRTGWWCGLVVLVCTAGARAQCNDYVVTTTQGGAVTPGLNDIGNHGDDAVTPVALPFAFPLYGASYTSVNVSSNGNLQFGSSSNRWDNQCLPAGLLAGPSLMPYWDDLTTDGAGLGVFTVVTGEAPARVFNIEWRAAEVSGGAAVQFQARLHESGRFEFVYGQGAGASATVGAQGGGGVGAFFEQVACGGAGLTPGTLIAFECPASPSPTGVGGASPSAARVDADVLLTVAVTPGSNPLSTGLSVVADLTGIGGPAARALLDDGMNGDVGAGDGVYSCVQRIGAGTARGPIVCPFTVSDAQGRSSGGAIAMTVQAPASGACCTAMVCTISTRGACEAGGGLYLGDGVDCVSGAGTPAYAAGAGLPASIPQPAEGQSGVTPGAVSVSIDVPPGSGTVRGLVVKVGLNHTWMGEVRARLTHNGTTVTLVDRVGSLHPSFDNGWQCNYAGVYTFADGFAADLWASAEPASIDTDAVAPAGAYHPSGEGSGALPSPSLSAFNGSPWEGAWTLTVEDWWALDGGEVVSFEIAPAELNQCPPQCGTSDYNGDGDSATDQDIEAFFACIGGTCCETCFVGGSDFNGDGDAATDQDIEAFFRVIGGNPC